MKNAYTSNAEKPIIFDVIWVVRGWLKKPISSSFLPADFWAQFDKHVEDKVFDCLIAANEAQADQYVASPVTKNGYKDEDPLEDAGAIYYESRRLSQHQVEPPPVAVTGFNKKLKRKRK